MSTYDHDAALARAAQIGAEHGKAAASWVTDGNTDHDTYAALLRAIEDGDLVLRGSPLSGEYTIGDLYRDCGLADRYSGTDWLVDELADAYEQAHAQTWQHELERVCRYHLEGN